MGCDLGAKNGDFVIFGVKNRLFVIFIVKTVDIAGMAFYNETLSIIESSGVS